MNLKACPFCGVGTMAPETTTATLTRGLTTVVITNVPAEICGTCREPDFDEPTTVRLVGLLYAAKDRRVRHEVVHYRAA